MDQLLEIIKVCTNGIKNPTMAIVGTIASLLTYIFFMAVKGKWRKDKAEEEKQKDKTKDQDNLERKDKEADASIQDRLNNRK